MLFFMPKKRHNTASTILVEFSPEGNNLKISFWEHKKNLFCFLNFYSYNTEKKLQACFQFVFCSCGATSSKSEKKNFFF